MTTLEVTLQYLPHDDVFLQGDRSVLSSFVRLVEAAIGSPDRCVQSTVGEAHVGVLCVTNANVLQELRQPATGVTQSGYPPRRFAEMVSSRALPPRSLVSRLLQILLMQKTPRETVHFDRDESELWVIGTEYGLRRVAATVRHAISSGRAEAELSDCGQEYYILHVTTLTA